jgi:hypothetical protein
MPDTSNGPALVSMAQQFTGLPMGSLIGGPLMAAAKANQQMALTQIDFLMSTCFTPVASKDGKTKTYQPTMIEMQLTRGVITPGAKAGDPAVIQNMTSTINLPLLTILPLNSLAVDNVTVNFVMEVSSSYSEDHSDTSTDATHEEGSFDAKIGAGLWSVEVKGSVSHDSTNTNTDSTHYQKSNSATYTVDVHAGQLPLPPGVGVIIQAYTNNISPIEMPAVEKSGS